MPVFQKIIFSGLCGLILICHWGDASWGAGRCVTEVLDNKIKAFPVSNDLTFELHLQKDKDLITIPRPGEMVDRENILKKDLIYTLPPDKYKVMHELRNDLVVQGEDGQRYHLSPETPFKLVPLPPEFNYTAIIPAGTPIKKKAAAEGVYVLDKDEIIRVIPPKHIQTVIQLYSQTRVDRMFDPGTSSRGTTIRIEPRKAPLGAYIKITVDRRDFDFGKAQFDVCLKLRDKDGQISGPFFASDNVELETATHDQAILRVRIPEEIDGISGIYFAKPVDLIVTAVIPGAPLRRAEVMTQQFCVSSRSLACLIWIFAFITPWFLTACVASRMQKNTPADQNPIKSWKSMLNPIWIVSGKVGGASLSLAQILLWSILVFSASFYVLVVSGKLLDLSNDVLVLLGLAGSASVIAKITTSVKDGKGQTLSGATEKKPRWLDLIKTEGRPDLYKFQMALFTTLAAVFVTKEIFSTLEFPVLPAGLLTLIGISNGVYLTAKASSKTAFEELAEIDREYRNAEETLKKRKNEATQLETSLNKTKDIKENMETALKEAKKQLDEVKRSNDTHVITELLKKIENQKSSLADIRTDFDKVSGEKKKADDAVSAAQQILDKLRDGFEEKKKQALQ